MSHRIHNHRPPKFSHASRAVYPREPPPAAQPRARYIRAFAERGEGEEGLCSEETILRRENAALSGTRPDVNPSFESGGEKNNPQHHPRPQPTPLYPWHGPQVIVPPSVYSPQSPGTDGARPTSLADRRSLQGDWRTRGRPGTEDGVVSGNGTPYILSSPDNGKKSDALP